MRRLEGLNEAEMCLWRALQKRFKIDDGEELFQIPENKCVHTTENAFGPYKTYAFRPEVVRDRVWRCPHVE